MMTKRYENMNRKLEIKELVHQIVFLILNREDYSSASQILINNNITIQDISKNTLKLTSLHFEVLKESLNLSKHISKDQDVS